MTVVSGARHIATIAAYPLKDGGFRGVYKPLGGEREPSPEVFETLEQARFWAVTAAYRRHSTQDGYSLAPVRRKGEYLANVWVRA